MIEIATKHCNKPQENRGKLTTAGLMLVDRSPDELSAKYVGTNLLDIKYNCTRICACMYSTSNPENVPARVHHYGKEIAGYE